VTRHAICRVFGITSPDPTVPLGPFLPPVVQMNVPPSVIPGDVLELTIRVEVTQVVPVPLPGTS